MTCAFLPCQAGSESITACSIFVCGKGAVVAAGTLGKTKLATTSAKHPIANLLRIRRPTAIRCRDHLTPSRFRWQYPHQARHSPTVRAVAPIGMQARIGEGVEATTENSGDTGSAQALACEFIQIA